MNTIQLGLLILSALGAITEAYFDAKKIIKNKVITHTLSALVRGVCAIGLSFLFFRGVAYPLLVSASNLIMFWMVFDVAINLFRGMSINYIGKTAFLDRMARKIGADGQGYLALKGVFLVIVLTILNYL